jgi:kinetochore protein Spc7/SPC105
MSYRNQLRLFFHPGAFNRPSSSTTQRSNGPISLHSTSGQLNTEERFFLLLLQSSLHALPQTSTPIASLLGLVSRTWDAAITLSETARRVHLETLTHTRILDDENLAVEAEILLVKVRTKVKVAFNVHAGVKENGDGLECGIAVKPEVKVVYGEQFNERKMSDFVAKELGGEGKVDGWENIVRALRERLVAQGSSKTGRT